MSSTLCSSAAPPTAPTTAACSARTVRGVADRATQLVLSPSPPLLAPALSPSLPLLTPSKYAEVDRLLRTKDGLQYVTELNVTKFEGGRRVNYDYNSDQPPAASAEGAAGARPGRAHLGASTGARAQTCLPLAPCAAGADEERADPEVVWRRYREGCSVRLLHPQRSWCVPASLDMEGDGAREPARCAGRI